MSVFTGSALENIKSTGNVWGLSQEYHFNFLINLPFKRYVKFQMRKKPFIMGRFGGGWNFVLGVQVGSSSVILNLGVMMVRIGVRT